MTYTPLQNETNFHLYKRFFSRFSRARKVEYAVIFTGLMGLAVFENVTVAMLAAYTAYISGNALSTGLPVAEMLEVTRQFLPFACETNDLTLFSGLVFISIVIKNGLTSFFVFVKNRFSSGIEAELGARTMAGLMRMPYHWHTQRKSSELAMTLQWRSFFNNMAVNAFLNIPGELLTALCIFAYLAYKYTQISIISISLLGFFSYLSIKLIKMRLRRITFARHNLHMSINSYVTQAIGAIRDIKIYGKEAYFADCFRHDTSRDVPMLAKANLYNRLPSSVLETIGFGALIFVVLFMHATNRGSTADIMGVVSLMAVSAWRTLPALYRILDSYGILITGVPYLRSALNLLDEVESNAVPSQQDIDGAALPFTRSLEFAGIVYRHNENATPALRGIDLRIDNGTIVGVVGMSGSGKTTLVDILTGLLSPDGGQLLVDDQPLDEAGRLAWRRGIGYVSQSPFILDGTVSENVAFGLAVEHVDHERVKTCCAMAAVNFLDGLPKGMDTVLGERGVRLSGGQRQRIAIARALYKAPQMLVFDEATSALDRATEHAILETIYSLRQGQTIVIVAHRLSTVERCDRLVWIEDGRLAMQGAPEDVLEKYMETMRKRCV